MHAALAVAVAWTVAVVAVVFDVDLMVDLALVLPRTVDLLVLALVIFAFGLASKGLLIVRRDRLGLAAAVVVVFVVFVVFVVD